MNENSKTLTFLITAIVAGVLAYVAVPRPVEEDVEDMRGKLLFDAFESSDAAEIKIVKYEAKNFDETTLLSEGKFKPTTLEIKKSGDAWVVASHNDYPIDAEGKIGDAATALMQLRIDGVVPDSSGDHEEYGVVQPDEDRFDVTASGVGTLVKLLDKSGDSLVNLVIGDEVRAEDSSPAGADESGRQRYVRIAGEEPVYIVRVDPTELSTTFKDWIVDDLLKIDQSAIQQVSLYEYILTPFVDELQRRGVKPLRLSELTFVKEGSDWKASVLKLFDEKKNKHVEREIAETEELDTTKLGDLRRALADMKIADVSTKPKPLADALRKGLPFGNDRASVLALRDRAFFPESRDGIIDVIGEQGDVVIGLDSGVEYVVRFGGTATLAEEDSGDDKADKKDGEEKKDDESEVSGDKLGLNRYCYVTARFNKDLIPEPEYEEAPKLEDFLPKKEETTGEEEAPKVDKPADGSDESKSDDDEAKPAKQGDVKPGESEKKDVAPEKEEKDAADPPTTGNTASPTDSDDAAEASEPADEQPAETAEEEPAAEKPETEKPETVEQSGETKPTDKPPADKPAVDKPAADKPETEKPAAKQPEPKVDVPKEKSPEEKAQAAFEKESARVKSDNEKKRKEHAEKIEKAREEVTRLNARFADWFYVIAESEYQKVHLSVDDLIKKKDPAADASKLPPGHPPAGGGLQVPGLPNFGAP